MPLAQPGFKTSHSFADGRAAFPAEFFTTVRMPGCSEQDQQKQKQVSPLHGTVPSVDAIEIC
jgi:hypothetical protein